jgi:hypothetical protein
MDGVKNLAPGVELKTPGLKLAQGEKLTSRGTLGRLIGIKIFCLPLSSFKELRVITLGPQVERRDEHFP